MGHLTIVVSPLAEVAQGELPLSFVMTQKINNCQGLTNKRQQNISNCVQCVCNKKLSLEKKNSSSVCLPGPHGVSICETSIFFRSAHFTNTFFFSKKEIQRPRPQQQNMSLICLFYFEAKNEQNNKKKLTLTSRGSLTQSLTGTLANHTNQLRLCSG